MEKNARDLIQKATVAVFGILLILGILEVGVRLFFPHPYYADIIYPDEKVGYKLKPDAHTRATNRFAEYDTAIDSNQEGFRDKDYPLEKTPGVYRIAVIGDSFTMAEHVEEKETFVRRLEALLNKDAPSGHRKVECMNFGINGYDTYQEVLVYEAYVRKYKPDMVLLAVYVNNDFSGNVFYLRDSNVGRPYFRLVDGKLQKVETNKDVLWENYRRSVKRHQFNWYNCFHLYNLQRDFLHHHRNCARGNWDRRASPLRPDDPQSVETFWKSFGLGRYRCYSFPENQPYLRECETISRLLLQKMERRIKEDGCRFCVIGLPGEENLFPERWPGKVKAFKGLEKFSLDFDRPYRWMQTWLPDLSASGDLLDPRPILRKAAEKGPVYFQHDPHYTKWGQESIARILADWLEKKLN